MSPNERRVLYVLLAVAVLAILIAVIVNAPETAGGVLLILVIIGALVIGLRRNRKAPR